MTTQSQLFLSLALIAGAIIPLWVLNWLSSERKKPLPPGPRRWPIIGNAPQMPQHHNWLTFTAWQKLYGDIVYLRVFGREVVILNSRKAVEDLLVHRSALYSDRPRRVMGELCGYSRGVLFAPYGDRWRKIRRLVHEHVSGHHATQYQSAQEAETNVFLSRLLEKPDRFVEHIRLFAGGLILKVTYGHTVDSEEDFLVNKAEEVMSNISEVMTHGAFVVEAIPILKNIPSWTPLMGKFLRTARKWRKNLDQFTDIPHEFVKRNMERGLGLECITSKILDTMEHPYDEQEEELVIAAASSVYAGGADTAVSVTTSFFLAMVLNPEIQKKAQDEIDRVIGTQRLPCLADRESLPYVECVAQECLRWNPVTPLVTHGTQEDDTYQGYHIPAGAAVVANVWAITHDDTIYPNPMKFHPERYETQDAEGLVNPHPRNFIFGFGRRTCPGQDMAEASLWIIVAATLAAFNITRATDENGMEIIPPVEYTSRSFSHPKRFPCVIRPRSSQALKLLQDLK